MSHRNLYALALALAAIPAAVVSAQEPLVAGATTGSYTQEPAPIERNANPPYGQQPDQQYGHRDMQGGPNRYAHRDRIHTAQPAHGVTVRSEAALQTVASDAQHVEFKLDHGRANVMVHDPAQDQLVLVDLPGGQTQLLKNGFYTFNADTNTVRVFSGEADAFAGSHDKPAKIKGDDQAVFGGGNVKVSYSDPYNSRMDVLPGPNSYAADRGESPQQYGYGAPDNYGGGYYGGGYYGGDAFYDGGYGGGYDPPYGGYYGGFGYGPYDAFDYPYYGYGWGYPYYGFGYGLGFGWGGGWGYGGHYGGVYGGRGPGVPINPGGYGHGGYRGGSVGGGGGFHGGGSFSGGGGHASGGGGGHR